MGSTNYLGKPKSAGYRAKSGGSSVGSDKEMNGKLRRAKIRRPTKLNEYGLKRVPDYTELAYKEAVSKLRYFLSGNYAPSEDILKTIVKIASKSVAWFRSSKRTDAESDFILYHMRSYGGSASIKNLDESDGDLDKKYSTYNTLSEYKPRPRLTAKYATLYADSLNNYAPQHVTNPPPVTTTPAADLSGGTNPDVINFIQKQEEYIEQLERESQYCRDELNNLLGKVKEVITENEHLHEAQKNKLISRMFHTYNAGSETDELEDLGDSTGLDSDNKGTPKSRKNMKTRSTRLEGPNIVFESRIAELEAQLTQAKIDLKKVQDENNENKRKLASGLVDSTCLDGFKRQIDNLQRDKSSLEAQITKLKVSLDSKDGDFEGRYKRGSDAVEHQLREERNNLEAEIRRLKDELAKERTKVRELAGEGARRAIQERSAAEQRYNAHFDELQHDLAAQYENVSKMQLDLERQRREENDLKRELSMKNAAIEELRMELKNKTASLQADLAQANAEKASLEEELASARLAIERHQRQAKHETNRLNSEIQSLRQRLDRSDAELVHSRRENLRLSEQISTLEKELNMKTLTPISPEKNKKEKELSTMFESMENKHAKTVAELESMIQSQNSLMEKLTGECRLLTDKLDDANRRHKEELATLQRQVENLGRSLQPAATPSLSTYQAQPSHTPAANRTIPHSTPNTGSVHTGADSSGDSHIGDTPLASLRPDRIDRNDDQASRTRRQDSRTSLLSDKTPETDDRHANFEDTIEVNKDIMNNEPVYKNNEEEKPMEVEHQSELEQQQEYETEPTYNEGNFNYEQNYEQEHPAEYQNQEYNQNYEQQPYTEQYENYEQYPQEYTDPNEQYNDPNVQYTDPNVQYSEPNEQYEGQYENYAPDGNYTTEQSYDNTQNTAETQDNQTKHNVVETQRTNSPKEKVPIQS